MTISDKSPLSLDEYLALVKARVPPGYEWVPKSWNEYMRLVEHDVYPADPRVPMNDLFKNENGCILNLAFGSFGGVAHITSTPNSVRSNHYHKTDWHFLTVVAGSVHYYWRPVAKEGEPKKAPRLTLFQPGDTFFTPPMMEHAVYSPFGSEVISVSKFARRHDEHEADLVRTKVIAFENGNVVLLR